MKILLVEDDEKIGQLIANGLQEHGHETARVQDGRQAWQLLEDRPVDLLITAWRVPGLSGTRLVEKLRRDGRFADLPIVMMSGRADKADIVGAIKTGVNGFLVKPFTVAQLLKKIAAVLQGGGPSLERQIQAVCKGLEAFDREGTNALVVFGEADNTAAALARPHRREVANYLVRAVEAIARTRADHADLDLGYVVDTSVKDVLLRTTRRETRDRVKLVLCSVECSGNRALLMRLLKINEEGGRSAFLVCDDYRQIPAEQRAEFEKLGADIFERQYLSADNLRTLIEGHVVERLKKTDVKTTTSEEIRKHLVDDVEEMVSLPTLPQVYHRIMQLALDPDSDIKEWVEAIRVDPMSCAVVILHARTPAYGFKSDIGDIDRAVVLLGKRTVRDLVANEAVKRAFSTLREKGFSLEDFWFHNAAVGFAAHLLSFPLDEKKWNTEQRRSFKAFQPDTEAVEVLRRIDLATRLKLDRAHSDPFIAGMMHDIGKAAMVQAYPGLFPQLVEEMENAGWSKPMIAVERHIADGVTHTVVGEILARKWGLGGELRQVIKNHHRSVKKPGMTFLVGLADIVGQAVYPFPRESRSPLAGALQDGKLGKVRDFFPEKFERQKFVQLDEFLELARAISPTVKRLTEELWASVGQVQ